MQYGRTQDTETIPALLVWTTFAMAILLSFVAPIWAIGFIIVFDLYWMYRVLYFMSSLSMPGCGSGAPSGRT